MLADDLPQDFVANGLGCFDFAFTTAGSARLTQNMRQGFTRTFASHFHQT